MRLQRDVFLMCLDRGLQHLGRQRHETVFDGADKQMRVFDQTGCLGNVRIPGFQIAAKTSGKFSCTLPDHVDTHRLVDNHMCPAQQRSIIIGATDAAEIKIGRCLEIMAGADGGEGQLCPPHIQRPLKTGAAKQHIHPVQWPHPPKRGGAPALAFRPGKIGQNVTDHRWQKRGGRRPFHFRPGKQEGSLWCFLGDKLFSGKAS